MLVIIHQAEDTTMNITTAKQCSSRDAATAILRKIGIDKEDYDDYIVKKDGIFYTDVLGAEKVMNDDKPVSAADVREVDHSAANAVVAEAMLKGAKKVVAKPEAADHSASNTGIAKVLAAEKVPAKKVAAKPLPKATKKAEPAKAAKAELKAMITSDKVVVKAKPEGVPPVAAQKGQKETVAEATRRMLLEGKSNIEIWEELLKQFPTIDEKKKQFPAWYRFDMKKKGQLPA